MVLYNYTKVKRREKRLYMIFNTTISKQGIVTKTIYTCIIMVAIFALPGLLLCKLTGTFWYNPILFVDNTTVGYFYMGFVVLPICIGVVLNNYKVQNYKLLDFLKMYILPKPIVNHEGKIVKLEKIKINGFIDKI